MKPFEDSSFRCHVMVVSRNLEPSSHFSHFDEVCLKMRKEKERKVLWKERKRKRKREREKEKRYQKTEIGSLKRIKWIEDPAEEEKRKKREWKEGKIKVKYIKR